MILDHTLNYEVYDQQDKNLIQTTTITTIKKINHIP